MKQSRTAAPVSMSASCLPLLCPVVGKAPVLTLRPKQKLPTPSQQALLTLLKQRHERYRTRKEISVAADAIAAHDRGAQAVFPAAHNVRQFDVGFPYSPTGSLRRGTSAANLLSELGEWYFETPASSLTSLMPRHPTASQRKSVAWVSGHETIPHDHGGQKLSVTSGLGTRLASECSDLAEHVVQRAKVRLKKRRQKRLLSLRAKRTHCEEYPEILSCPGSQILLLREQRTRQQLQSLFMHSSRNSSGQTDHKKDSDILTKLEPSTRLPMLPEARSYGGSPSQENVGLSSSTMQIHPKWVDHSTDKDSKPKLRVVYLSERQSATSESSGIPNAPPATPNEAHKHTHSFKYVPSLHDIKSQRQLKTRLREMMTKAKERSLEDSQAAKEEERKRKEAVAKLKIQQRAEIYALNKIMTEYEEQKFQASLSVKV